MGYGGNRQSNPIKVEISGEVSNQLTNFEDDLKGKSKAIEGISSPVPIKKGVVSFTFDNSYIEQYEKVFPLFKARNLPFALSPVSNDFSTNQTDVDYYDYTQLKEMVNSGAEIIAHSTSGLLMGSAGLDLEQVEFELVESKRVWNKAGFKINGFCPVSSNFHSSYHDILKKHYDYGFTEYWSDRTVDQAVIDETNDIYSLGRLSLYTLYTDGGVQKIKDAIDYASDNGKWLNFYNHRFDLPGTSDSIPISVLTEVIDYALTKNVDILQPTTALQRVNSKLVAGENITRLQKELDGRITKDGKNFILNPQLNGTASLADGWDEVTNVVSGVTKSFVQFTGYRSRKYAYDATDNTGKYSGMKKTVPLAYMGKVEVITVSAEAFCSSNNGELEIKVDLKQNGTVIQTLSKTQKLVKGRYDYEASMLLPNASYHEADIQYTVKPLVTGVVNFEIYKPKLEYSRSRTEWKDFQIETTTAASAKFGFTNVAGNNSTPTVTGFTGISLNNSSPTTITDFISTGDQELTLMFMNGNTTIKGSGMIRLKDGMDFTGSSGDVLTLVRNTLLSTAWFEKSRADRTV